MRERLQYSVILSQADWLLPLRCLAALWLFPLGFVCCPPRHYIKQKKTKNKSDEQTQNKAYTSVNCTTQFVLVVNKKGLTCSRKNLCS